MKSSATRAIVSGTFSDGLSTTVLPHVSAIGSVHIGTMNGKLNGTIDATTPTGSCSSWHVTPLETGRIRPCASCGSAARPLDRLEPLGDVAGRLGHVFAILLDDEVDELLAVLLDQRVEAEHDLRAALHREPRPARERRLGGRDRRVDNPARGAA